MDGFYCEDNLLGSVLIKELDHYLDQGSSDVWYTIEISKFASSLNSLHYQLHVANIKLTWVMFDEILLSTPLMAAKYDDKNKLIIKTFSFLLAFKKWKEGKISNKLAQACWNWMGVELVVRSRNSSWDRSPCRVIAGLLV